MLTDYKHMEYALFSMGKRDKKHELRGFRND